jgi:hypothetical protein
LAQPTWCIFDPPYLGAAKACGAYDDTTVDYPDLVQRLLHAKFRWVLSEYDNKIYRPLGEPRRIMVRRSMGNSNYTGGIRPMAEECLWSNFKNDYGVESNARGSMPKKMDVSEVVSKLQAQRDEIDAALRALTRVAYQNFPATPTAKSSKKPRSHHAAAPATPAAPDAPGTKPKTKGNRRKRTAAEKLAASKIMKANWAKRKAAAKK